MASTNAPAALPAIEREALARIVSRFGLSDVLLDLAAAAEVTAAHSNDLRAIERRGEVARKLLSVALAAESLRL